MQKSQNTRAIAAKILASVVHDRTSLSEHLPPKNLGLTPKDEAIIQELCYGVCRWYYRLESISQQMLNKPFKAKDQDVFALVLLGLYQLSFMRTPAHAAVSETVNACLTLKKPWAKGLLNAVLRRFQREQSSIEDALKLAPNYEFAHPEWLLNRLKNSWPEQWASICTANNQRAPMVLRVNQEQYSRDDYLALLDAAEIAATPCQWAQQGVRLNHPCNVDKLPEFHTGAVSVQDEAAQLAAPLLQLQPDMRVLDACAAPGGKTCHLHELEPKLEQVVALELDAARAKRIHENLQRLNLTEKTDVVIGDAAKPEVWWDKRAFDRILLDAPCSATGVIRRHPDIKLLRCNKDIDKLAKIQLCILETLWSLLKPGGILLYATCSILSEENEHVLSNFLNTHIDAKHDQIAEDWGIGQNIGRHLLPSEHGPDGFYYARLIKSKNS